MRYRLESDLLFDGVVKPDTKACIETHACERERDDTPSVEETQWNQRRLCKLPLNNECSDETGDSRYQRSKYRSCTEAIFLAVFVCVRLGGESIR